MTGDVSVQDDIMTLKGTDALAVLKNGKYKNFDLTLDLRTTPGDIACHFPFVTIFAIE